LGLILFLVALWVLHKELREYHYQDVISHLKALPKDRLLLGCLLTFLNYLIMAGYDLLALRYVQYQLPYRKIALVSFIGYAFSNNMSPPMLTAGSVRYRLYSTWGLSAEGIAKIVAFCIFTFWLGFLTLGGTVFLLEPTAIPRALHIPFVSVRPLGAIFLGLVVGYLTWSLLRKGPLKIGGWEFPLPSPQLLFTQIGIACVDWALAGTVLYALLPLDGKLSYAGFISIFLLAQLAGIVSQVPGGLGVFETMALLLLSPYLPAAAALGALFAYRVIYYLLPLGVAAALLGIHEFFQKEAWLKRAVSLFGRWVPALVPQVLSITTFIGGVILLFSGATPELGGRLAWIERFLPLPVMEISHFLGSLAGTGLLLLARGLQRRLDAAYVLTVTVLVSGIIFSLLRGFDYEEAIALSVMLGALLPCRGYFYRKASLLSQRLTLAWVTAIVLVLLGSVWLGLFSYKHVEYSGELWWRFALSGDASRFLRATVGAFSFALFFALSRLLAPAPPEPAVAGAADLEKAAIIMKKSRETCANLAFLGDKDLLFSGTGKAFIMYGIEGRSWIALGDPIGPEEEWPDLVWQFREMADRREGWTVFYEVKPKHLPLYLDLGLTLIKIGEEARVPLDTFSLEGRGGKGFRHLLHHVEGEGCSFELIPPERVSPLLPKLKQISDAWLADKHTREKRFSLGYFKEDYIRRFPAAIVRREGKVLAFANVWLGAEKEELSFDLMRYLPESPHGVMDYLFIQLMFWGKQEGYRWFNLGMAPLSGLGDRVLSPLWSRLGAFVFRHGEHFYNFQGLRQYKEKFDPDWEPRYLATPAGLALPRILTNLTTLISGGLKGIVAK
jgi:phosphatidylglycerol lysyltransferase